MQLQGWMLQTGWWMCVYRTAVELSSAAALWGSSGTFCGAAVSYWWRNFRETYRLNLAAPTWNELLHWITWTRPVMTLFRPEGAATLGRAEAWAPAPWTSTAENEPLSLKAPATTPADKNTAFGPTESDPKTFYKIKFRLYFRVTDLLIALVALNCGQDKNTS